MSVPALQLSASATLTDANGTPTTLRIAHEPPAHQADMIRAIWQNEPHLKPAQVVARVYAAHKVVVKTHYVAQVIRDLKRAQAAPVVPVNSDGLTLIEELTRLAEQHGGIGRVSAGIETLKKYHYVVTSQIDQANQVTPATN